MPASIPIAMFVLGGVLLLIALLGGNFGLFGADVRGQVGCSGRFVAALGAVILFTALLLAFLVDRSVPLINTVNNGYNSNDNQNHSNESVPVYAIATNDVPNTNYFRPTENPVIYNNISSTPIPTVIPNHVIDVRGTWQGTFLSEGGTIYDYQVSIMQSGSRIEGTTHTSQRTDPQLSTTVKFKGSIKNNIVSFEEYELVNDTTGVSCFIKARLTYIVDQQGEILIGTWSGSSGAGGCPGNGELDLRKA